MVAPPRGGFTSAPEPAAEGLLEHLNCFQGNPDVFPVNRNQVKRLDLQEEEAELLLNQLSVTSVTNCLQLGEEAPADHL